jgi:phosphoesterase RecJ-like protein
MTVTTEFDQVVDELRQAEKLLLTTHENPDGDALGSLVGMHLVLRELGKDSIMFMAAEEFPLPVEYRHLAVERIANEPPEDIEDRVVVFLDCGNIDRMPVDFLRDGTRILNIDHHHDNTRFGTVNYVEPGASCTAEIVWRIAHELGVELTRQIGEALYVGLVTDTGRFMYDNTGPAAHRMAAELIEVGIDTHRVYRRIYEDLPFTRMKLLARALGGATRYDDGLLTLAHLTSADYDAVGASEADSEGIVDHLRSVEGTAVAALVRQLPEETVSGATCKVSLRSADGRVDVSRIARANGGGGHPQAAGFSTECGLDELVERIRAGIAEQL